MDVTLARCLRTNSMDPEMIADRAHAYRLSCDVGLDFHHCGVLGNLDHPSAL